MESWNLHRPRASARSRCHCPAGGWCARGQLRDEATTARSRIRPRNRTTLSCLLGLRSIPLRWSIPLRLSNRGIPPRRGESDPLSASSTQLQAHPCSEPPVPSEALYFDIGLSQVKPRILQNPGRPRLGLRLLMIGRSCDRSSRREHRSFAESFTCHCASGACCSRGAVGAAGGRSRPRAQTLAESAVRSRHAPVL